MCIGKTCASALDPNLVEARLGGGAFVVAPRKTESKTVPKTLEGPAQKYYVERPAQKYRVEGGRLRNIMLRYFNYFEIIQSLQSAICAALASGT